MLSAQVKILIIHFQYCLLFVEELHEVLSFISHVCLQRAGILTVLDKESLFARYMIMFLCTLTPSFELYTLYIYD